MNDLTIVLGSITNCMTQLLGVIRSFWILEAFMLVVVLGTVITIIIGTFRK